MSSFENVALRYRNLITILKTWECSLLVIFFYKGDNYKYKIRMKRWNAFIPFIKTILILKTDKKDIDVPADIPEDEEFEDEG